jgi:hypothetical protein
MGKGAGLQGRASHGKGESSLAMGVEERAPVAP